VSKFMFGGGAVSMLASGQRVGAFVVFSDENGVRYAVRLGSVLALSDGDDRQDTTVAQLPGGRAVLIQAPLEEVLGWFG
jgi:hypothetical protein